METKILIAILLIAMYSGQCLGDWLRGLEGRSCVHVQGKNNAYLYKSDNFLMKHLGKMSIWAWKIGYKQYNKARK